MGIQEAALAQIAADLRSGKVDIESNAAYALRQLNEVDSHLMAFLTEAGRSRRVMERVHQLQAEYADIDSRPALYGVPIGVKDIFRVDGLPTRGGSALPTELLAGAEADCVKRLRNAGALVLGKTVTTEFAFAEPGPTRNPHNHAHTPGGSSSGSAAAVAAGLVPLALGTQTIGSVIRPAAFCGVVGFKPSYGRIDPSGVLYVARSLDHVGIFTQDVAGMRLAASILCRDWREDAAAQEKPVLAVPQGAYLEQASAEGLVVFEAQIQQLEAAGYEVVRVDMLEDIAAVNERHWNLMAYEMAREHADWFAEYDALYRPRTADLIRRGQAVHDDDAAAARQSQSELRQRLSETLDAVGADLWICPPATGPAPEGLGSTGDTAMNLPWTHAGVPVVSIPAGWSESGLPMGLQCIGQFGEDERLLGICEALYGVFK